MEAACGGEGMEGRGGGGGKVGERGERPRNKTAVGLAVGALLVAFRGVVCKTVRLPNFLLCVKIKVTQGPVNKISKPDRCVETTCWTAS